MQQETFGNQHVSHDFLPMWIQIPAVYSPIFQRENNLWERNPAELADFQGLASLLRLG